LWAKIVNLLREEAEFVDVQGESDISPDPDDNVFCACAEDGADQTDCPSTGPVSFAKDSPMVANFFSLLAVAASYLFLSIRDY
jgi:hypothetical protein